MGLIGDIYYAFRGDGARLQKDAQVEGAKAGTKLGTSVADSFRKSWSGANIGKGLVQGLGLAGGLGAAKVLSDGLGFLKDGIVGTATAAIDFQRSMQNVNSIAHLTDKQLVETSEAVLKLSGDFGQSAQTMADGLYDISSSGFQGADALKVLEAATKGATAGLATTGESAKGITAVLNAYGLSADDAADVSDVLFETVNRGVISFPELADQIGKTTALAAPLKVSLREVAAAVALMTRNGVGAEDAFTQINAVMASMLQPSAQAVELATSLGLAWDSQSLKANGLVGQMQNLIKATGGNEAAMATILGDARAIRGAFVLAQKGGAAFTSELEAMAKASGATDRAFAEQSKSTAFHIAQMNAKIEAAGIEIGTKFLPIIASVADVAVDNLVPALNDVADALQTISDIQNLVAGKFDATGDKAADLGLRIEDLAGMLPFVGTGFGLITDAAGELVPAMDDSTDAIEDLRGSAAEDLADTEESFEGAGQSAMAMAGTVEKGTEKAEKSVEELASAAASAAQDMVDDYFDPIETAADLLDSHMATKAAIEERRQAKSKAKAREAARAIIQSLDDQATAMVKLGERGKLTAGQVDRFESDVKASYKALGQKVPPELQKIIDKLRTTKQWTDKDYTVTVPVKSNIEQVIARIKWLEAHGETKRRALGGPVTAGTPYVVGEHRPELFVPESNGRILPRVPSSYGQPSPGTTMNLSVNVAAPPGGSVLVAQRFGQAVLDVVADGLREQTARSVGGHGI